MLRGLKNASHCLAPWSALLVVVGGRLGGYIKGANTLRHLELGDFVGRGREQKCVGLIGARLNVVAFFARTEPVFLAWNRC